MTLAMAGLVLSGVKGPVLVVALLLIVAALGALLAVFLSRIESGSGGSREE